MNEYIDRETAIKELGYYPAAQAYIRDIPLADVAPVTHGQWEWFEEWLPSTPDHPAECQDCGWRCSECKTALEDIVGGYWDDIDIEPMINYCPNCGARLDGGNDEV